MTKQEYERYKAEQEFFKCKFCGKLIKVGYNLDGLKLLTTSCIDRQCAGYKKYLTTICRKKSKNGIGG